MAIAYAEPAGTTQAPSSSIFRQRLPAEAANFVALCLIATAGSTTTGMPIKEPHAVIRQALATKTTAGQPQEDQPVTDAALIRWLHDKSGLTWGQIARAFYVSRRAVHLWANKK